MTASLDEQRADEFDAGHLLVLCRDEPPVERLFEGPAGSMTREKVRALAATLGARSPAAVVVVAIKNTGTGNVFLCTTRDGQVVAEREAHDLQIADEFEMAAALVNDLAQL